MKSKKAEPKPKVKIKSLKLHKETVEDLSDTDAAAVKGGGITYACGSISIQEVAGYTHNDSLTKPNTHS